MARQRDSKLVGTIGNLIFYNHLGDYRMRTKPVSVKRTTASVNSGLNFGKASKMSRQIRNLIAPVNPSKSDGHASYRFTGALNKFISWKEKQFPASPIPKNGLPFIQGFQFNDQADLTSITAIQVSVKPVDSGMLKINLAYFIPSQSLHAPSNTNSILFKMVFTGTSLTDVETKMLGTTEIEIPYNCEIFQPPVLLMPGATNSDDLLIMVMAVQYMVNKIDGVDMLTVLKKMPCGVVWEGLS
jgi:hypothetical protein